MLILHLAESVLGWKPEKDHFRMEKVYFHREVWQGELSWLKVKGNMNKYICCDHFKIADETWLLNF